MEDYTYQVIQKQEFDETHRTLLAEMLEKQGKVQGNLLKKIEKCKTICIASRNDKPVAIGAPPFLNLCLKSWM